MFYKIWARVALVAAALVFMATLSTQSNCNELADGPSIGEKTAELIGRIEHALSWLVQPHRWHPLHRSDKYRYEWSNAIAIASTEHEVPALLLTAMGWFEGSYQKRVLSGEKRGKARGELGMWQQHGAALASSKKKGYDLETKIGQARAGASWLKRGIDHCGSIEGGLTIYACGRCKVKEDTRPARQVALRLGMWQKLKDVTQGKNNDEGRRIARAQYRP